MKNQLIAAVSRILLVILALSAPAAFAADQQKVVNINEASASQLALLPRVGPSLSARIVEFRDQNGKFKEKADLMLVSGIGEKTFQLMEPYVAVAGETTLTEKVRVSQIQPREDSDGAKKE
jgi:competence ComEA-like helix-hairpin-helix protein